MSLTREASIAHSMNELNKLNLIDNTNKRQWEEVIEDFFCNHNDTDSDDEFGIASDDEYVLDSGSDDDETVESAFSVSETSDPPLIQHHTLVEVPIEQQVKIRPVLGNQCFHVTAQNVLIIIYTDYRIL